MLWTIQSTLIPPFFLFNAFTAMQNALIGLPCIGTPFEGTKYLCTSDFTVGIAATDSPHSIYANCMKTCFVVTPNVLDSVPTAVAFHKIACDWEFKMQDMWNHPIVVKDWTKSGERRGKVRFSHDAMKKTETKCKTRFVNDSLNPVWNQTFDFFVEDALHDMLIVQIWDQDTFGKRKKRGVCSQGLQGWYKKGNSQINFAMLEAISFC